MRLTNSVIIERPLSEVFTAWSELERIPDWYEDSIERRKTCEGPVGVGTTYHAVDKVPPGRRIEGTLTVTRYEADRLIEATLSEPYNSTWQAIFEDVSGSTLMTMPIEVDPGGVLKLLAPLVLSWTNKVQQRGLEGFKSDVESR